MTTLLWCALTGGALLSVILGITLLMPRRSAAERHTLWCIAMTVQMTIMPLSIITPPLLQRSPLQANTLLGWVHETGSRIAIAGDAYHADSGRTIAIGSPKPAARSHLRILSVVFRPIARNGFAIWLSGVLVMAAKLLTGLWARRRLLAGSTPVTETELLHLGAAAAQAAGVNRTIHMRVSNCLPVPVTWGWRHPHIVLPDRCETWPRLLKWHVLLHETAHIERADSVMDLIAQFACVFYWFSPLTWLGLRRMRYESELSCDEIVLERGAHAVDYATSLLSFSTRLGNQGGSVTGAHAMARKHDLESRIVCILRPSRQCNSIWHTGRVPLLATAAISLTISTIRPRTVLGSPAQMTALVHIKDSAHSTRVAGFDRGNPGDLKHQEQGDVCAPRFPPPATGVTMSGLYNPTTFEEIGTYRVEGAEPVVNHLFLQTAANRCIESQIAEPAQFGENDDSIIPLRGTESIFREKVGGTDRIMRIHSNADGTLTETYTINGSRMPVDRNATSWLHHILPEVIRQSHAGVDSRVERLLEDRGLMGLLAEISVLPNNTAIHAYLAAAVRHAERNLTDDEFRQLLSFGESRFAASPMDLAEFRNHDVVAKDHVNDFGAGQ